MNEVKTQNIIELLASELGDGSGHPYGGYIAVNLHGDGTLDSSMYSNNSWSEYHNPIAQVARWDLSSYGWIDTLDMSNQEKKLCSILGWYGVYENIELRGALSQLDESDIDETIVKGLVAGYNPEEFSTGDHWSLEVFENFLDNNEDTKDVFLYMYDNDTIEAPVFETIPEGYTKRLIERGSSPEYSWSFYFVYDPENNFCGIFTGS